MCVTYIHVCFCRSISTMTSFRKAKAQKLFSFWHCIATSLNSMRSLFPRISVFIISFILYPSPLFQSSFTFFTSAPLLFLLLLLLLILLLLLLLLLLSFPIPILILIILLFFSSFLCFPFPSLLFCFLFSAFFRTLPLINTKPSIRDDQSSP